MKFVHAGAIYAIANVASAAVPFLLLPLLTRMLGPLEYGHVVSFALLITLCTTVAGLNSHAALGVVWFTQPRNSIPAYTGTALGVAIGSTLIVMPLVAVTLSVFPKLGGGITPGWGAIAALTAGSNVVVQCRLALWQSQQRPYQSSIMQFANSVSNVVLSLIAVLLFGWGGDGRNAGIAVATILMACIAIALFVGAREVLWAPSRAQLRTLIRFGLPLILHTLAAVLLSTADRWMVSVKLGQYSLGVYGAGAQLGMVMAVLADAFVKAYSPWLYTRLASTHPDDKYVAVGAVYAAMPTFLCAALMVGAVLQWVSSALLGPQYQAATAVLPWFMLGGAFSGIYVCTSVLYFFSGRTSLLAFITSTAAILSAGLTWALVSTLGVNGAAIGYALTQGILALFTTTMAFKSFDLPWGMPRKALTIWVRRVIDSSEPKAA